MITSSKLKQFLFGARTVTAWDGSAFTGPDMIRRSYLSLTNRAAYLNWPDQDIYEIIIAWHDHNQLERPADWDRLAEEMIAVARRDVRPRRPARTKAIANSETWSRVETVLRQSEVLSCPKIAELTSLSVNVVKQQLFQKLRLGWLSHPSRGQYTLTAECGQQRPRKPRRQAIQKVKQIPTSIPELLEEQAQIESQLRSAREYNENLRIEAEMRDRQYPKGKSWQFMPGELKDMYMSQFGVYRSTTLPGKRFAGTNRMIDTLVEIEQELDRLGYVPDQYEIEDIAA
jgi:hypothetical protein